MYQRWPISNHSQEMFQSLRCEHQGFANPHQSDPWENIKLVAFIIGFLLVGLLVLMAFVEPKPGKEPDYLGLAGFLGGIVTLAVGAPLLWSYIKNRALATRIRSLAHVASRHGLNTCGYEMLKNNYRVPWFQTEAEYGPFVYGLLCGKWNGDEIAYVEGNHMVDRITRGSKSTLVNAGAFVLARDFKRQTEMAFDAVVFNEKLQMPDVIVGQRAHAVLSYMKHNVPGDIYSVPEFPTTMRALHWEGTSDPRGLIGISDTQFYKLLKSKPCIVQVIDGTVVVITNWFATSNLLGMPKAERSVEANIDFARNVFQELKTLSHCQQPIGSFDDVAESQMAYSDSVSTPNAAARSDQQQRSVARAKPRRPLGWLRILAGAPLALFGVALFIGNLLLAHQASTCKNWPQASGKITHSEVKTVGSRAKPIVKYSYMVDGKTYTGSGLQLGADGICERHLAMLAIGPYPKGTAVKVHYSADVHGWSSLRVDKPNSSPVLGALFALLPLIPGLLLLRSGIWPGKPKPNPTQRSQQAQRPQATHSCQQFDYRPSNLESARFFEMSQSE